MTLSGDRPIVCLITSGKCTPANFSHTSTKILDLISAAVFNRISLIQIREKKLGGKQLFDLVVKAVSLTTGSMTKLLVNGRTDVAIAAGADGVHLPSDSYSPAVVRKMAGIDFEIGVSTHSLDEIDAAKKNGANYVVFGPIFNTPGKTGKGIEKLAQAVVNFPDFPILGLGGIDETNLCEVLDTGAAGFAAIRYLNTRVNLEELVKIIGNCGNNDK